MRTSWKQVCAKLKMNNEAGRFRGGSDESVTSDDTTVTSSGTPRRNRLDNEWQMNYMIVNRNDGLFVSPIVELFLWRATYFWITFLCNCSTCVLHKLLTAFCIAGQRWNATRAWKERRRDLCQRLTKWNHPPRNQFPGSTRTWWSWSFWTPPESPSWIRRRRFSCRLMRRPTHSRPNCARINLLTLKMICEFPAMHPQKLK